MKILGLCFLLFVCLATFSQAQNSMNQDSANPPKNNQAAGQSSQIIDHLSLPKDSQPTSHLRLHKVDPYDVSSVTFSEPFCAYMRTYRVRREYRNSDVVSPSGYTTCVPSARFEVRSAVQVQSESDPRK
jgi:hypothetical protein